MATADTSDDWSAADESFAQNRRATFPLAVAGVKYSLVVEPDAAGDPDCLTITVPPGLPVFTVTRDLLREIARLGEGLDLRASP